MSQLELAGVTRMIVCGRLWKSRTSWKHPHIFINFKYHMYVPAPFSHIWNVCLANFKFKMRFHSHLLCLNMFQLVVAGVAQNSCLCSLLEIQNSWTHVQIFSASQIPNMQFPLFFLSMAQLEVAWARNTLVCACFLKSRTWWQHMQMFGESHISHVFFFPSVFLFGHACLSSK